MPLHPSGEIVGALERSDRVNKWAFAELFALSSAPMHAWREIEQSHRRERIPAATARALPEMSCAGEAAVNASIALRTSQNAPHRGSEGGALFG